MRNPLVIRKDTLRRLVQIPIPEAGNLMLVRKRTVALWLFYAGILIAFFGTLTPWFLWPIARYVNFLAAVPIAASLMFSSHIRENIFTRTDYALPLITCFALQLMMALTSGKNIFGLIVILFIMMIFLSLLRLDKKEIQPLGDMLAKSMACLLAVSIPFYLLYLLGFNLPHSHIVPADWDYSYENYRFFLVDDRAITDLIPRFHSVFLEPSHLGMACIGLLYCQIGRWNTWRCRILFLAIALSFSLAAYICLVVLLFSSAWMKGKAVVGKLIMLGAFCATIVVGSIFYNKGDNLVNVLIVQRMTVGSDGKFEGDNRTSDLFTKEYEKMVDNGEVFLGKGMEAMARFGGSGNSGYRVFLYTYGLVSVFFVLLFFFALFRTSDNLRAKVTFSIISLLSFVAHGIPTKFYWFIPLYILVFSDVYPTARKTIAKKDGAH